MTSHKIPFRFPRRVRCLVLSVAPETRDTAMTELATDCRLLIPDVPLPRHHGFRHKHTLDRFRSRGRERHAPEILFCAKQLKRSE